MREYVFVIFFGIVFIFLYNYFAFLLRALGNSVVPLWFLCISAGLNIVLDLLCVIVFQMDVSGAAFATVVSQIVSGVGIALYTFKKVPEAHSIFKVSRDGSLFREVLHNSFAACIQQSVMNFGILMIQGLVNSFGMAGDGSLCSSGEDRYLCLYAGTGIWKCFFFVCIAESWGGEKRPCTGRNEKGSRPFGRILHSDFRSDLCIRTASYEDFCRQYRDPDHSDRCTVSAD